MQVFGEGDYIVPVLGVMWAVLGIYGVRLRQSAPRGTERRARGFWIALWSIILSVAMFGLSAVFFVSGK